MQIIILLAFSSFLLVRVKVSVALQLLSAGTQRQRGAGGKPGREAETSSGTASPAQHCSEGPLSSAFPVSVFPGLCFSLAAQSPCLGPFPGLPDPRTPGCSQTNALIAFTSSRPLFQRARLSRNNPKERNRMLSYEGFGKG